MKVTDHMIYAYAGELEITATDAHVIEQGLKRVLKDVPDVAPFAFAGYPDNLVYIHSTCGIVVDVNEVLNRGMMEQIERGECDCENNAPWHRIYVERTA